MPDFNERVLIGKTTPDKVVIPPLTPEGELWLAAHMKTKIDESPGVLLGRLGTDGALWASEFRAHLTALEDSPEGASDALDATPGGWLHGWFANAIEAGISAGYARARREWLAGDGDAPTAG